MKNEIDPHSQPPHDRPVVDQFFGRKQNWGNQLCFRPRAGQASKLLGLPCWVRVLSKSIGWHFRHSTLEIVAARTPCGEPVKP